MMPTRFKVFSLVLYAMFVTLLLATGVVLVLGFGLIIWWKYGVVASMALLTLWIIAYWWWDGYKLWLDDPENWWERWQVKHIAY